MVFIRLGILAIFVFCFLSAISAVSFTIDNSQTENEIINVSVSLSGLTSSSCTSNTCYLQGGLKASSTGQYFGMTRNTRGDWHAYRSNPGKETIQNLFFSFSPSEGSWSGTLSVKVNPEDFGTYHGPGQYYLRVWRYSGKSDDYTDAANEVTVSVIQPTLSPVPTPTNFPTPTCTPTTTSIPTSTSTPKPTSTTTPKPTEKQTPTKNPSDENSKSGTIGEGEILGTHEEHAATTSAALERAPSKKVFIITFLFIGIGCALLSIAIVLRKTIFLPSS